MSSEGEDQGKRRGSWSQRAKGGGSNTPRVAGFVTAVGFRSVPPLIFFSRGSEKRRNRKGGKKKRVLRREEGKKKNFRKGREKLAQHVLCNSRCGREVSKRGGKSRKSSRKSTREEKKSSGRRKKKPRDMLIRKGVDMNGRRLTCRLTKAMKSNSVKKGRIQHFLEGKEEDQFKWGKRNLVGRVKKIKL